ncbi:pro-sigmaK processing inhibitor BofA family protein [Paenibacillus sonchi]|nr:pro-sigmaK processing inhibitor BofA family protein [Paenibacillus sonchi]
MNFSGLLTDIYIPLNPATIGAVTVLGLPGVLMLMGLKLTLF